MKKIVKNIIFYLILAVLGVGVFFGMYFIRNMILNDPKQIICSLETEKITLGEYNFHLWQTKKSVIGKTDKLSDAELAYRPDGGEAVESLLKEGVESSIKFNLAVRIIAKENGIEFTEKYRSAAIAAQNSFINSVTENRSLDDFLKEQNIREEDIFSYFRDTELLNAVKDSLYSEGKPRDLTIEEYQKARDYYASNMVGQQTSEEFFDLLRRQKMSADILKTAEEGLEKENGYKNIKIT